MSVPPFARSLCLVAAIIGCGAFTSVASAERTSGPVIHSCATVVVRLPGARFFFEGIKATGISCTLARKLLVTRTSSQQYLGVGGHADGWTCTTASHSLQRFHFPGRCHGVTKKNRAKKLTYVYNDA